MGRVIGGGLSLSAAVRADGRAIVPSRVRIVLIVDVTPFQFFESLSQSRGEREAE